MRPGLAASALTARLHLCSAVAAAAPSPASAAAPPRPLPPPPPALATTAIKPQLDYKSIIARRDYIQQNVVNR